MFATLSLRSASHLCMAYEPPCMSTAQRTEKEQQERTEKAAFHKRLMEIRQEEIIETAQKLFLEHEAGMWKHFTTEGQVQIYSNLDIRHMYAAVDLFREAGYNVQIITGNWDKWYLHVTPRQPTR